MGILDDLDQLCPQSQQAYAGNAAVAGPSRSPPLGGKPGELDAGRRLSKAKHDHLSQTTTRQPERPCDMTLGQLQIQVSRYGFRPSHRRSVMEQQLEQVQQSLALQDSDEDQENLSFHASDVLSSSPSLSFMRSIERRPAKGDTSTVDLISDDDDENDTAEKRTESELPMSSPCRPRQQQQLQRTSHGVSTGIEPSVEDSEGEEDDDAMEGDGDDRSNHESESCSSSESDAETSSLRRATAAASAAKDAPAAAVGSDNVAGGLGNVPADVARQLHDVILSDKDVYRRILQFEPVAFDEIQSLAKRAGVKGLRNKEMLRTWLDVQCICFYTSELTGQRQRY